MTNGPLDALRHHVTGAVECGEAEAITEQRWVSDKVRAEYGSYMFAVYVYYAATGREVVSRNLPLAYAEEYADKRAAEGHRVHVSLDTCG